MSALKIVGIVLIAAGIAIVGSVHKPSAVRR